MPNAVVPALTAVLQTDDDGIREHASRILADAGIAAGGAGDAADIVVLLLGVSIAERLAAIAAAARAEPGAAIVAAMPPGARGSQLRRALLAGADGLLLDDQINAALVPTLRAVACGQLAVPHRLRPEIAPQPLSYREKEVLALVVRGYTNRQIATALFVAESTVKTHLSSAFGKLDAHSRSEAAALILDRDDSYGLDALPLPAGVPAT